MNDKPRKVRKAVFPVAGFGTRFLPATKAMPKELLPIIDKPVIQYAAEEAIRAGITTLIFVTGRTKRAIEDHFDANLELEAALRAKGKDAAADMVHNILPSGVNCIFIRQPEQLGLGHAVACAETAVGDEPFAVLLADDFILSEGGGVTANLVEAYQESGKTQLSVMNVEGPALSNYGVIKPGASLASITETALQGSEGRDGPKGSLRRRSVEALVEKPSLELAPSSLASIGRYILTPDIFNLLRDMPPGAGGEIQLADAINIQAKDGAVESVELEGQRFDCGSVRGYLDAILHLADLRKR